MCPEGQHYSFKILLVAAWSVCLALVGHGVISCVTVYYFEVVVHTSSLSAFAVFPVITLLGLSFS